MQEEELSEALAPELLGRLLEYEEACLRLLDRHPSSGLAACPLLLSQPSGQSWSETELLWLKPSTWLSLASELSCLQPCEPALELCTVCVFLPRALELLRETACTSRVEDPELFDLLVQVRRSCLEVCLGRPLETDDSTGLVASAELGRRGLEEYLEGATLE